MKKVAIASEFSLRSSEATQHAAAEVPPIVETYQQLK
jgi:hypothetical protein